MIFLQQPQTSPKQLKFTHSNFQENSSRRFSKRVTSLFCIRKLMCHVFVSNARWISILSRLPPFMGLILLKTCVKVEEIKTYINFKVDDFTPNYWNYQTHYIRTSYKKIVDLFCTISKLELDQDIWEVYAKFQHVSIIRFGEFRTESQETRLHIPINS